MPVAFAPILAQVAAPIYIRPPCQDGQEIGHMFAQPVDIDADKERRQFRVDQQPVIQAFGHAGGHPAAIFHIE